MEGLEILAEQAEKAKSVWRAYHDEDEVNSDKMVFEVWKRTYGKRHVCNEEGKYTHTCVAGICSCSNIPFKLFKLSDTVVQKMLHRSCGDLRNTERKNGHVQVSLNDYVWCQGDQAYHGCLTSTLCPFSEVENMHKTRARFRHETFFCETAWTPHYCGNRCKYLVEVEGFYECELTGRLSELQKMSHWKMDKKRGCNSTKFSEFKKLVPRNTKRTWFTTDFLNGKQQDLVKLVLKLGPEALLRVKRSASKYRARNSQLCHEYYFYACIYIAAMFSDERFAREREKELAVKADFEQCAQR